MNSPRSKKSAFTLIELIIVIAIIAILAAAIFVAIDPARRMHEARNAVRASDVATILEAVKKYQADAKGPHHANIADLADGEFAMIGTDTADFACRDEGVPYTDGAEACAGGGADTEGDCVDLSTLGATYLSSAPFDPSTGAATNTRYYIGRGAGNNITIGACDTEGEGAGGAGTAPTIEVSR